VRDFLGSNFTDLTIAGSHGFQIDAGDNIMKHHIQRESFIASPFNGAVTDQMEIVEDELRPILQGIENVVIENNKFTLSVHYRNVESEQDKEKVSNIINSYLGKNEQLVRNEGKMVIEIRPNFVWNKGYALEHIAQELKLGKETAVIVVGDDLTDEDAFAKALALDSISNAIPIFVSGVETPDSEMPRKTHAKFHLRNVYEVYYFLDLLVEWHKEFKGIENTKSCMENVGKLTQT
jgi:trehalose-phosphatase